MLGEIDIKDGRIGVLENRYKKGALKLDTREVSKINVNKGSLKQIQKGTLKLDTREVSNINGRRTFNPER